VSTYKQCSVCFDGKLKSQPYWIRKNCCNKTKGEKKVCDLFDPEFINLLIENNQEYKRVDLEIFKTQSLINSIDVSIEVRNGNYKMPQNATEFIHLLQVIHFKLFEGTGLLNAGCFRTTPVYFDGGEHAMEGSDFKEIRLDLEECWDKISHYLKSNRYDDYVTGLALFFPRFFRVHPFRDGNGRCARIFANIVLKNKMKILRYDSEPTTKRRYVKALRYAHRRFVKRNWPEIASVKLIKSFIEKHLHIIVPSNIQEEVEPE